MYNNKEHNELVKKLMKNGTIFVPKSDYEIIKIDEHDTYFQIWYKYDMKLYVRGDETGTEVSWVKVPFKNINQHLRTEKIKRLTNNVTDKRIR